MWKWEGCGNVEMGGMWKWEGCGNGRDVEMGGMWKWELGNFGMPYSEDEGVRIGDERGS
jgi:hypothetical protein